MCGIFGAFSLTGHPLPTQAIEAMSARIAHRGPDADGYDADGGVVIGNRRLSVIDLTTASDQPLYSDDRQIVLVQNGEIYNYIELRDELRAAGQTFHTTGDTEVLLRAYEHWGPDFITRINGMFAIAVHDKRSGEVHLYRDRLGVKPLYLAEHDGRILFASEIKSILEAGMPVVPNHAAMAQFFALNYVPPPGTAFSGITHLMPGSMARITSGGIETKRFWDLSQIAPEPEMTRQDAEARLLDLLDDATRIRLRSDADFGAFLSGGLDSTSVVGMMRKHLPGEIRTFSIGFDDPRFDETKFAQAASDLFGTTHRTQIADPDITTLWPRFIYHCDQPHGDVSFMPMDMVSRLAVSDVKMVLTGDGGDELFAGYEKYLGIFPDGRTDALGADWHQTYARQSGLLQSGEAGLLTGDLGAAFADADPYAPLTDAMASVAHQDPINQVLFGDTTVLLPGNNLVKPDRMSMASSLEVRAPFLDYRMAEFAFQVPGALKLADGETKAVYKSAMLPMLGEALTYRRKQMFTVPIGEWFKQALAGFCREMLLDGRLAARGLFDMDALTTMVESHINGRANYTRQVRALISLEIWFRLFVDRDPATLAQARA